LWAIVLGPLGLLNNDPARSRLQLWPDALRMIAARPMTGWGEDATGLVFGRFVSANWAPGIIYDRTHSGILEISATQGILGLVALGLVLLTLFRGIWRHRFDDSVAALGAACIGFTVCVAFNFDWAPATGAFWLLAGTAWSAVRAAENLQSTTSAADEPVHSYGGARSIGAVVLVAAAVWFGAMPVLAETWYWHGRPDLAVKVDPFESQYHWAYGLALDARGSPIAGVGELQRAADLGETDPQLYVDLGDERNRLRDIAAARRDYRIALLIDPYFAAARQRLANLGP
jgi:hypothetical protein